MFSFLSSVKIYTGTLSRCVLPLGAFNKKCSKLVRFPALEGSRQGRALRQLLLQDELLPQPHSTLPLLSSGMPAQPDPDAKGSGGDEEGVVGVEVVLREVALLHQLGLHGPGDVADLVQLDGLVDIFSDATVIGRVLVKDLLPAIEGEVLSPLLVALGLLLAVLQVGDVLTHVVSQLGGNKTSGHLLHARGLRASPYKDLLARVEDEHIS